MPATSVRARPPARLRGPSADNDKDKACRKSECLPTWLKPKIKKNILKASGEKRFYVWVMQHSNWVININPKRAEGTKAQVRSFRQEQRTGSLAGAHPILNSTSRANVMSREKAEICRPEKSNAKTRGPLITCSPRPAEHSGDGERGQEHTHRERAGEKR